MKTSESPKKSWIDILAFTYFSKLIKYKHTKESSPDSFHLLDEIETKAIKNITFWAMFQAASCGSLGVILLYLPLYLFPSWFPDTVVELPFVGSIPIPIIFTVYGIVLIIPELYALTLINLNAVYKIAKVCGFPDKDDPDYEKHLQGLYRVGMEQESKEMASYGIQPFADVSKYYLLMTIWLNRLKGSMTNILAKFLLSRVLGRLMFRYLIDMVGIVVYAFWNARATHLVIREAKVRIMAPFLINKITQDMYQEFQGNEEFREFLHNTLQLIALMKRKYHDNHYLLTEKLVHQFALNYQTKEVLTKPQIIEQAKNLKPKTQEGVAKLLIFGMLIDGKLSRKEKNILQELQQTYPLNCDWNMLKRWESSFFNGKGLDELFETKLLK